MAGFTFTSQEGTEYAPDWGNLLPAGPEITARDGRKWVFDLAEIIAAFQGNHESLPVDYEHGQDLAAPKGLLAPAAGWIVELADRDGALWGRIDWTDRASRMVADGAYRYLSASMKVDRENRIAALRGAGLVNRPALFVEPLLPAASEIDVAREARQLASRASEYLAEQAALGRNLTITEAVMIVREGDCRDQSISA